MAPEMQDTVGKEAGQNIGNAHCSPEESQPKGEFVMFVKVRQVQYNLRILEVERHDKVEGLHTSGINPPCKIPRRALHARKEARPSSLNWAEATMDHRTI